MNHHTQFSMFVSHCQIAVFDPALGDTFNDWEQRHVDQGFSWRSGSVSFRTVEEAGNHLVSVELGSQDGEPLARVVRVIDVPFDVSVTGVVEIATVCDSKTIQLLPGPYQLRFECSDAAAGSEASIRLLFSQEHDPKFRLGSVDGFISWDSPHV